MQPRVYLSVALALLGYSTLAHAQQSGLSTSTVSGIPWVADRAIGEGAGIKTGNVEWHPGISGQFGYDSNYLQRANSGIDQGLPEPSLHFRVTPQLSIRTLDRAAEEGKDVAPVPRLPVTFYVNLAGSYNEFLALNKSARSEFANLRHLDGGGSAGLNILPGRVWSSSLAGSYTYIFEPSNQGGFGSTFSRHVVGTGANLNWAPGGGRFRWTLLQYGTQWTFFDSDTGFNVYNNGNHAFTSQGMWRFLPKTALLYDGRLQIIRYDDPDVNSAETLQARIGINGLVTKRLAFLAMGGWTTSFYRSVVPGNIARNYDGFVGKAELKWFMSADGKLKQGDADVGASALAVGYLRDYNDSYLADFFRRDRGYAQMSYLIGGRVITTAEVGASRIAYPEFNSDVGVQQGFAETRIDVQGFAEYRPIPTVGVNLLLRYDQNISKVLNFAAYSDDLSFNRFRAMLGVRWFL